MYQWHWLLHIFYIVMMWEKDDVLLDNFFFWFYIVTMINFFMIIVCPQGSMIGLKYLTVYKQTLEVIVRCLLERIGSSLNLLEFFFMCRYIVLATRMGILKVSTEYWDGEKLRSFPVEGSGGISRRNRYLKSYITDILSLFFFKNWRMSCKSSENEISKDM
jgi:hypothetical protein